MGNMVEQRRFIKFGNWPSELLVTPMQVLNYVNLLATKGKVPNCHFVFVDNLSSNVSPVLRSEIWDSVYQGMRGAIKSKNGTGKKADINLEGFKLYGKTGTAENPHGDNHAWFVGWADYNDKKFSIVILLEMQGLVGQ